MQLLSKITCLKCRAFLSSPVIQQFRLKSKDCKKKKFEILEEFGFCKKDINTLLANDFVDTIGEKRLRNTINSVQRLGFNVQDILQWPGIFHLKPGTVDHRYKSMEEGGLIPKMITLAAIRNSRNFMSQSIETLKKKGYIDKEIDVARNILSYSDMPAKLYPKREENESLSIKHVQTCAVESYLTWKFDLNIELLHSKLYNPIVCKSIRVIMQNYDVLTANFGFSKEKIKLNLYLLNEHPDQFFDVLESIPVLGELPIKSVMKQYPKLLTTRSEKLLGTLEILKEFNIAPKSISMLPNIMFLSSTTLRQRLQHMYNDPIFKPYFHNPRILSLIVHYNLATTRNRMLTESKWRCRTLDLLSLLEKLFDDRVNVRGNDTSKGHDVVLYLKNKLKMEPKEVREGMKKNPYWQHIPIITIAFTLEYLQNYGFDISIIRNAMPILLYPMGEVEKCLKMMDSVPELDCCRDDTGKLRPELTLHLILYYLERPYHFSGNGVWERDYSNEESNFLDHVIRQ